MEWLDSFANLAAQNRHVVQAVQIIIIMHAFRRCRWRKLFLISHHVDCGCVCVCVGEHTRWEIMLTLPVPMYIKENMFCVTKKERFSCFRLIFCDYGLHNGMIIYHCR